MEFQLFSLFSTLSKSINSRLPREKSRIPGLYHTNHEIPDFIYTLRVKCQDYSLHEFNLEFQPTFQSFFGISDIFRDRKTPTFGGGGFLSGTAQ